MNRMTDQKNVTCIMPRRTGPQKLFDQSGKRFNLSVWGRQSGKSTGGYRKLFWKPLQSKKDAVYWHILQTYAAADIIFERYLKFIHPFKDQFVTYTNESDRRVTLIGNRNVFFKSGHNFEDLRTESLDGVIIDEARQQPPELWPMVIYPMLSKSKGWADIMTSPNGYDWVYDLKNSKAHDPSWNIIHAPSTEAWWWDAEEIHEAKKNMTDLEFRQEIMAEFVNVRTGKAYVSFGEHNHKTECPFMAGKPWSPYHSIVLAMDFNLTPMAWTLGQVSADHWWWFDEVHISGATSKPVNEVAAEVLVEKLLMMKAAGYRGEPNLILCGDATGKTTQRTSNKSDYDILKQVLLDNGISFKDITPESNPSIKDRVNSVNVKCRDATGHVSMHINPLTVPNGVKDLDRVSWKKGGDFVLDPGKNREHTHNSDGIGYAIHKMTPPKAVGTSKRMKVLQRTF